MQARTHQQSSRLRNPSQKMGDIRVHQMGLLLLEESKKNKYITSQRAAKRRRILYLESIQANVSLVRRGSKTRRKDLDPRGFYEQG